VSDLVDNIKQEFEKDQEYWQPIYDKAREDLYFLSDKPDAQWSQDDLKARERSGRPSLTIDQLGQHVNQVVNDIRKNTPSIEVIPDTDGDIETAEIQQDLIRDILYNSDADTCFDTAAAYSVKSSIGFIRVDTSYVNNTDFNQELKVYSVVDPLTCYLDRDSTSLTGEDAKRAYILECISEDDFKTTYPNKEPVSFTNDAYIQGDKGDIIIAEYFSIEIKKKTIGVTTVESINEMGEVVSEQVIEEVQEGVEYSSKREVEEKRVKRCKVSGADVLEETEFVGENIPLVPVYGNQQWVNGKREIYSLIRKSKDAQKMFNFWKSLETELLQKQPRANFMAAAGQTEEFADDWSDPDQTPVLRYKPTDIAGNPVNPPQRIEPPVIPTGVVNASRAAVDDIKATIGMYAASLGQASNEVSGIAIQRRNEEGDTATYHFSDNLSKSISRVGKILKDALPKVYDTPRYVSIIDKEGNSKSVGINGAIAKDQKRPYYLDQGSYKTKVITGASYTTQRQEAAEFFNGVVSSNPELMPVIGDLVMKYQDFAGADAIAARMEKYVDPRYLESEEEEIDPEKVQMQQVIEEGQKLIEELQAQVEDLSDEVRDKQGELIIKAKSTENTKQYNEEKNDIDMLKVQSDNLNKEREFEFKMAALKLKEEELRMKAAQQKSEVDVELTQYNDNPERVEVTTET
jgi:hypothetical protein